MAKTFIDYKGIGKRIKERRLALCMTQEQLSEKVDISFMYMSNIETAKSSVGLRTLISIANELDVDIDYLLSDSRMNNQSIALKEIEEALSKLNDNQRIYIMDIVKVMCDKISKI